MNFHRLPAAPFPCAGNRCFVAWICALLTMSTCLRAQTVTWDGGGDGVSWHDPLNWSGDALPGPTNDVAISLAGASVQFDGVDAAVRSVTCSRPFTLLNGSLVASNGFAFNSTTVAYGGGAFVGTVQLTGCALSVSNNATAPAEFVVRGSCSIAGTLHTGQSTWVQGGGSGDGVLNFQTGAVNRGVVRLESISGGWPTRLTTSGAVTNDVTGEIRVLAGSGGARSFEGELINRGLINATNYGLALYGTYDSAGGQVLGDGSFYGVTLRVSASPATNVTLVLRGGTTLLSDNLPNTTLWVQGGGSGDGRLTAPDGFVNHGTIRLQSIGGAWPSDLVVSTGVLHNAASGVLEINTGTGGPRNLTASLDNEGTLAIESGTSLYIHGANRVWNQLGGTVNAQGRCTWADGAFNLIGGEIDGELFVRNGVLDIASSATVSNTVIAAANCALLDNLSPQTTIWVRGGGGYGNATLTTHTNGSVNLGGIRLQSSDGGWPSIVSSHGNGLTNGPTGAIHSLAGSGGTRSLTGTLVNQGLVSAESGYHLDLSGEIEEAGGRFEGSVRIRNSLLRVTAAPDGPTTMLLWGANTLVTDNLTNVTLLVQGGGSGNASLNWTNGGINFGGLVLDSIGGGWPATLNVSSGTLYNHEGGLIEFRSGAGGARTVNAALVNDGEVRANLNTTLSGTGARHANHGAIHLTNATLTFSGASFTNHPGALLAGAGAFNVSGLTFHNAGRVRPGASAGRLTFTGSLIQSDTAQFDLEIGGPTAATDFDQVVISGTARLAGTVNLTLTNGYVPDPTNVFPIVTYASLTGGFNAFNGLAINADLGFEPVYTTTQLQLRTLSSTDLGTNPPSILVQPVSQTVERGQPVEFRVSANGSPPLHYQWRFNDGDLPGETANTLSFASTDTNQIGGYTVVVTNPAGAVTSAVANLIVTVPSQIVHWNGAGDGLSWHDPLNWSGNFVPGATNDVIADVPDLVTITAANNVTVRSFQSEEALLISGGTFTLTEGTSWVNGGLTVNASRGLTVLGSNTTFTADGPTAINSAVLAARDGASFDLPTAHAFTSGQLILSNNATATLPALTNVNLSRFLLYAGSTFELPPTVTAYNSSGGMGINEQRTIMLAQGAGTWLDLSSLQTFEAIFSGLGGLRQLITATAGAEIDLSGLATATGGGSGANGGGPLEFRTDATGVIRLDALTLLDGRNAGILINCARADLNLPLLASAIRTHFQLPTGAEFSAPQLASLQLSRLTLPDARFVAPSLTTFANSTLNLSGSGVFEHGELSTVDLSRFLLSGGASYTLPASIQSFSSSDSFAVNEQRTLFSATGAGTRLDLSSLTNLTGVFSGLGGLRLLVIANLDGEIDLSGLQTVTGGGSGVNGGGPFEFRSDATGKVLLSALETATGTGAGLLFNLSGTNDLGADQLVLANAELIVPTNSLANVGTLQLGLNGELYGVGFLQGDVLNGGIVRPGTSPGQLTILGNYTQAVTGTFIAEVGGPLAGTQYDQLVVTGHAVLDGILDLRRINNYAPDLTNTFRILDSGFREGQFSSVVGADAGASVEFVTHYDTNGVWLGLIFASGPSVVAASPSGTVTHTFDHFLLTFSEPLTASTFTTADVSLVGPGGAITANAPQFLSNAVWRLSFATQTVPGEYTLAVGPAINDLAGNPMNQNGDELNGTEEDRFIHTVTVPAAVDFAVTAILAPDTAAVGTPVLLAWTVANESTNAAAGPRTDAVYLSTDRVVGNDVWLGEFTTAGGLDAGESRAVTNLVMLPAGTSGTRYFIVMADSAREWFEVAETNNTFISTNATIVSAADLTVTSVTASETSAQFGESVTVTWVVRNNGAVSAGATWRDRLYLSPTAAVTAQSIVLPPAHNGGPLAAGASYTNSAMVTLPLTSGLTAGTYYLVVAADVNNAQAEANEANNVGSRSIALSVPPLPDLVSADVFANVSLPPVVPPGEPVEITWTVTNAGTASAAGGWTEAVYAAEVITNSTAVLLGRFHFTNDLAIGATLTRTQTVVLPPTTLAGEIWFGVLVDSEAAVVESDESNNAAWSDDTTFVPPALTVTLPVSSVAENTGNPALTALVQRNGSRSNALDVSLATSHTNKLAVPSSVTIPAGQASTTFTAAVLWDSAPDADVLVTLTASAAGFTNGATTLEVRNADLPQLTLLPAQGAVAEGDSVTVTVSRSPATDQPLLVNLTSHSPTDLVTPVSVTIPAHSNSASFMAAAPDDTLIQPPRAVTLTASAAGHVSASTLVTVLDDDFPQVVLLLNPPTVAENAAPGTAIGTVVRLSVTSREVTMQLASSDTNSVLVPYLVTIPPNEAASSFALNVVDDDLINGTRVVDIMAWVTDSLGGGRIGTAFTNQLTIIDDDGPALTITLPRPLLPEGSNQLAVVTRNTPATNDLFVTLLSSDPAEATVPASVVIPVGTNAATFLVSAIEDGTPDGTRSVTLTSSAAGHEPGQAVLQVTDINLPDLVVTDVSGPPAGFTRELVSLSFRVANHGLAPLTNPIVQRVWLSDDPLQGDDTLVGEFTFNQSGETIAPGLSFQQTVSAFLPQQPGDYWVIVTADALNAVLEIDEHNNTRISAAPIQIAAEYTATVQTEIITAPAGTVVPLTGQVTMANGQSPEGRLVSIHIERGGFRRVIGALAQADGSFAVNFRPLPNEAGVYTIGAAHPGETSAPVQDTFTLLGARFDPTSLALTLAPDASVGGFVTLRNLGDAPLAGLTVTPVGVPANLNVLATLATNTLPANGAVSASYGIAVTASEPTSGEFVLRVTSAEGLTVDLPVNVIIRMPQAQLVAQPANLEAGMLVGGQKLVPFEVINQGGATSGPVQVVLPQVPWLTVADVNPLPPLAPGETNVVTLQLTPPADLPLTAYDGQLAVLGGASAVPVPFRFIALSEARGALAVHVEDENTYYTVGQPRVAGATVRLLDPFSGGLIAETTSDTNGAALFPDLAEGPYTLRVEAAQHDTFSTPVTVAAGLTNSVRAFVAVQTVAYRWTVVPTEVQDRYRMSLETTFEANVPWPVVTVDQPLIVPLVFPGEVTQMEITLTNHGLIAAQGVQLNVRDTATYRITPLIRDIGELPARSSITIPVLIQLQPELDAQAVEAIRLHTEPGAAPAGRVRAADGGWGIGDECEYPEMEAYYFLICGADRRWHLVKVDIRPLLAVKELAGCAKTIVENSPNLIKSPVAGAMGMICDCLIPAAKKLGEWMGVPTNTKAMECICAAIGLDIAGMAKCVCYKGEFSVPTPPPGEGGGGSVHINPVSFETGDCIPGMIVPLGGGPLRPAQGQGEVRAASGDDSGVCAQIRLRLDQELVLTRNAFRATLEIENRTPDIRLADVFLRLDFYDGNGENAASRLIVTATNLTGLTAVDGSGAVPSNTTGIAQFIILPTTDAAPFGPAPYLVGGELRYTRDGQQFLIPLNPAAITVLPEPTLTVRYFHQRDVFSDDPRTPEIEPAIPYALGMIVENHGAGTARNVRITSGQPRIVDNDKGLLIDFQLIASEVAGQNLTPSLTVNLGDIPPGANAIAKWLFTSSLQGLFIDYQATFEHLDGLGNPRLSLVDAVEIHEMIRVVRAPLGDALPDFLVNDVPDDEDLPDTVYLSDGSVQPVAVVRSATVNVAPSATNLTVQFDAPLPSTGFGYLRVPDPQGATGARRYQLVGVSRLGGAALSPENFWQTDRTFIGLGRPPVRENLLHLFDHDSTGQYVLTYAPVATSDTTPPTSAIAALPPESYPQIPLQWSGADNPGGSGLAGFDLWVSENGGPFTRWLEGTLLTSAFYPGVSGHTYAFYSTAVDKAGNREPIPGAPDAQTTVSLVNTAPTLSLGPDRIVDEGETVVILSEASDSDAGQTLTFSLLTAPPNATIHPATGVITWPTGETDGPGTNLFVARVADNGLPSLSATASVTVIVWEVNSPPRLAPLADHTIPEGFSLLVANVATDLDLPPNTLAFSFGATPPPGASLDAVNGLFHWRPTETQGPSTNLVSIVVTDDGVPPLSATQSFTVIVLDVLSDIALSAGVTNLLAGESVAVPLVLDSSLDATNLSFVLATDAQRLTNLTFHAVTAEVISLQVTELDPGRSAVNVGLNPALRLAARRPIVNLTFAALSNRGSAIVPIALADVQARRANGETVSHTTVKPGYAIVVERESVLLMSHAQPPVLTLFGLPGRGYALLQSTNLGSGTVWTEFHRLHLADRSTNLNATLLPAPPGFFRALEVTETSLRLELLHLGGNQFALRLEGQPGATYTLQTVTHLAGAETWSNLATLVLTNSPATFYWTNQDAAQRFFRARTP